MLATGTLAALALLGPACSSQMPYRAGDQARRPALINPALPNQSGVGPTHQATIDRGQAALLRPEPVVEDEYWTGRTDAEQWQYARRDADLAVSRPAPLQATDQWPEPARRVERPFRFRFWQFN